MKIINLPINNFPMIKEQFLEIPAVSTIGVANNSRLFYKKNADFLTSSWDRRNAPKKLVEWGIAPEKIIMTFFMWDNILNRFKSSATYLEYLQFAFAQEARYILYDFTHGTEDFQ